MTSKTTGETEDFHTLLRDLTESRLVELPDYANDPTTQSRIGKLLASKCDARPITRKCLENMGQRSRAR